MEIIEALKCDLKYGYWFPVGRERKEEKRRKEGSRTLREVMLS